MMDCGALPFFCAPVGGAVARWRLLRVVVHGGFWQLCPFGKWGWGGWLWPVGHSHPPRPRRVPPPGVRGGGGVGLGGGVAGDVADAAPEPEGEGFSGEDVFRVSLRDDGAGRKPVAAFQLGGCPFGDGRGLAYQVLAEFLKSLRVVEEVGGHLGGKVDK